MNRRRDVTYKEDSTTKNRKGVISHGWRGKNIIRIGTLQ